MTSSVFSKVYDRRPYNSAKWNDIDLDVIPMWIADMDFKCPPEILLELNQLVHHGILGYSFPDNEYFESVANWFNRCHGTRMQCENIISISGVMQAAKAIIEEFSDEGDYVIIQPPTYYRFKDLIQDCKRVTLENCLYYDPVTSEYSMDLIHLNELVRFRPKILILCSPHNPIGKVWDIDTLEKLSNFCVQHKVLLVVDEVHCDLVFNKEEFISCARLQNEAKQNLMVLNSPTKTFNFTGLRGGNLIVFNSEIKARVSRRLDRYGLKTVSSFYIAATKIGYTKCEYWLRQVLHYIEENYNYTVKFISMYIPLLSVQKSQSTYLIWINYSKLNIGEEVFIDILKKRIVGIGGSKFGGNGVGFVRLNIAVPFQVLQNFLMALKSVIEEYNTLLLRK